MYIGLLKGLQSAITVVFFIIPFMHVDESVSAPPITPIVATPA